MRRRDFLKTLAATPAIAAAQQTYERRTRGLPRLTIKEVRPILTSAGSRYQWVIVKVITSEPGLYGIGSASNVHQAFTVAQSLEKRWRRSGWGATWTASTTSGMRQTIAITAAATRYSTTRSAASTWRCGHQG